MIAVKIRYWFLLIIFTIQLLVTYPWATRNVKAEILAISPQRRVNIPFSPPGAPYPSHAIFWFGKVDQTNNYSDVRIIYYDDSIRFTIHTIDRRLWQDSTPSPLEVRDWDSVTIYLDKSSTTPNSPQLSSYQINIQLGGYEVSYKGNGTTWQQASIPATSSTVWRGDQGPNSGTDAKGWQADILIPFTSFGINATPDLNTVWRLAVEVNDRDDAAGTIKSRKIWPETMLPDNPDTWGVMAFGWKPNNYPIAIPSGKTILRHGLNNITVKDGEVGGGINCGSQVDHWSGWGSANYNGYNQINIQNQWDISEWPCFSKFYITFPLASIPMNKTIISAKFTMNLFGTAGEVGGNIPDSYIQVFTVGEDWSEATLNWNNGPLARENISGTWVKPRNYNVPYESYSWELREAFVEAYQSGQPLRLVLYSADGPMHTGKYFWSSDTTEWSGTVRPTLEITWGDDCRSPGITCYFQYLPGVIK